MPTKQARQHAERHRDHDRGKRDHGAFPLPEDSEIEEAERHQEGEAAVLGVVRHEGEDADQGDPGDARPDQGRVRSDTVQEAGREEAARPTERLLDQPGDRAGQLLEGEQTEARVVAQPVHQAIDPDLERDHPGAGVLERPGREVGGEVEAERQGEQDEPGQPAAAKPRRRRHLEGARGEQPSHLERRPVGRRPAPRARLRARAGRAPARRGR